MRVQPIWVSGLQNRVQKNTPLSRVRCLGTAVLRVGLWVWPEMSALTISLDDIVRSPSTRRIEVLICASVYSVVIENSWKRWGTRLVSTSSKPQIYTEGTYCCSQAKNLHEQLLKFGQINARVHVRCLRFSIKVYMLTYIRCKERTRCDDVQLHYPSRIQAACPDQRWIMYDS